MGDWDERDNLIPDPDWQPPEEPGRVPPPAPGFAGEEEVEESRPVDFSQAVAESQASLDEAYAVGERTGQPTLAPMVEQRSLPEPPAVAELDRHRRLENNKAQAQQDRIDIRRARAAGNPAEAERIIRERKDRERKETGGTLSDAEVLQRHAAGQWDESIAFPDFGGSAPSTTPYEPPDGREPSATPYEPHDQDSPPAHSGEKKPIWQLRNPDGQLDSAGTAVPWQMPGSQGGGIESNQQLVDGITQLVQIATEIKDLLGNLQSRW